jgi:hypothetical protein
MWTSVAVVVILAAYGYPLIRLLAHHHYGSLPYQPFSGMLRS